MAARKEWLCESPSHFLPHLELSHSACLGGVNRIPNVMNDMERFHSAVLQLPETDAVKVISCIQEVRCPCRMISLQLRPGTHINAFRCVSF